MKLLFLAKFPTDTMNNNNTFCKQKCETINNDKHNREREREIFFNTTFIYNQTVRTSYVIGVFLLVVLGSQVQIPL